MSEEELINLSWNKFQTATFHAFKNLQDDTHFTDVTLVGEDGNQMKAHKVIVSASSPFFNNILVNNPHQHPLIYLKGVNHVDLTCLLKFIYTGEVQIQDENLATFLVAANDLQIEGLAKIGTTDSTVSEKVGKNQEIKQENESTHRKDSTENVVDKAMNAIKLEVILDEPDKTINLVKEDVLGLLESLQGEEEISTTTSEADDESDDDDYEVIDDNEEIIEKNTEQDSQDTEDQKRKMSNDRQCDICKKEFTTNSIAADHKQTVHEGLKYLCDHCDVIASSKRSLRSHIEKKHPNQELPIIYTSVNGRDLNFEKIIRDFEPLADLETLSCSKCNITFKSNSKFRKHERKIHGRKFTCRYCSFTSNFSGNLKRHEKSHSNTALSNTRIEDEIHWKTAQNVKEETTTTEKFQCKKCDRVLATKASLKVHTDAHEGKKWPCDQCDHQATTTSNLVRHQKGHY